MFLLSRIDAIINIEMYKHGLQFSRDWANPYWTYLNLNYVALGVPVALSLFAIAVGFTPKIKKAVGSIAERVSRSRPKGFTSKIKKVGSVAERLPASRPKGFTPEIKKVAENVVELQPRSQPAVSQERKRQESNGDIGAAAEEANVLGVAGVFCPNCGKTFGRPMVMLDFEGGKSKLVNVCPYCNHVLGDAEDGESSGIDVQIADLDEKLTH
jgi:uncharacterized Zn-finger protein